MTNDTKQPSAVRSLDGFYPREMFVGRFPGESIEYSQEDDFDPDSLVEDSVRYVRWDLHQSTARSEEAIRDKALEDAARVCDEFLKNSASADGRYAYGRAGTAIRQMKGAEV